MRTMTLYRISLKDLGDRVTISPTVPNYSSNNENKTIPRICACPTIMQCIESLQLIINPCYPEFNDNINLNPSGVELYLYKAEVPIDNIIQPGIDDVYDSWITGEMWIIDNQVFTLVSKYKLRKHMSFPNVCLSRYVMEREDCNRGEIIDRYFSLKIYGDIDQFSFIDFDSSREKMAEKYYEDNPFAYEPNFKEENNNA